jgi:RNA polymerase subunit RPABC4/transcription elongation factor Spt4
MTDKKASKRMSIFDMLRSKSTDEPEMITIREETKSLVRILKAKPKAIKHMSEVLGDNSVSKDELKITEAVVASMLSARNGSKVPEVLTPGRTSTPARAVSCLACGAPMPGDSDSCPRCHSKYIHDILPGAIAELERAELTAVGSSGYGDDDGDDLGFDEFPIIHFDAVDGVINYLDHTEGVSDFVLECSNCGTLIQLDIDRCPLCGNPLKISDVGLLSLIQGSDFNEECLSELECPHCGEHVTLGDGCCPACGSIIVDLKQETSGRKVIPLIDSENVVFIHIDLETGDLNYLQRHINSVAIEHTSIRLDGIGNDGFNENWQGLSRI